MYPGPTESVTGAAHYLWHSAGCRLLISFGTLRSSGCSDLVAPVAVIYNRRCRLPGWFSLPDSSLWSDINNAPEVALDCWFPILPEQCQCAERAFPCPLVGVTQDLGNRSKCLA